MEPIAPLSSIESILWPALTGSAGAALLAMQYQLDQSQWWSPEELRLQQFNQLNHILGHAFHTVPYYQKRLKSAGVKPESILQDNWSRIPILKRKDIQDAGKSLLSTKIPPEHGKISEIWTSGSTGRPICVRGTSVTSFFWEAFTLREHLWHERDFSGKLAVIRHAAEGIGSPPDGITNPGWGPATNKAYQTGPSAFLNITSTVDEQAEWLQKQAPDYLLTYPSILSSLASHFYKTGEKLSNLREVRTLGEALDPVCRGEVRKTWGVKIADMYSSQEVGYIALQCPEHEHYHVQSENLLLEILNEKDEECKPGEVGRVVITTLHNFANPLIRYEIGDYAEVGDACPCGRGLPVIKRVLGRVRNMIVLPSGQQRWPVLGYKKFEEVIPVRQIQTIQHAVDHLEMKLAVNAVVTSQQEAQLTDIIQKSLGYPFRITFTYLDEIPRSNNGKYEEFISKVKV